MTDVSAFCVSPSRAISYGPLSVTGNEIRILVLEPPSPEDSRIRCHLEHASLFDLENDFVALSYHWGDHTAVKRIVLSGELVPITFSLYKALDELRQRGFYRVVRSPWIHFLLILAALYLSPRSPFSWRYHVLEAARGFDTLVYPALYG